MTAYLIVFREEPVRDEVAMAEYSKRNRDNAAEFREQFGITPLVAYGQFESLEGEAPDGVVMLQFPSFEAAKSWYESPAYQEALAYRKLAANCRAVIVEGL